MTEREKIIKVIDEWASKTVMANKFDGASVYNPHNATGLADALIAAGLVADVQSLADGNCVLYVKGKGFMRLYNEQYINEMRHRAEVAERAWTKYSKWAGRRSCPCKGRCDISNPSAENDYQECYEAALRVAEKELSEKREK